MSWIFEFSDFWQGKAKSFRKRHPNEMTQMVDNLDHYLSGLNSGLNPMTYHPGFLHAESCGAKAIDAKGIRKPAQTRLYLYVDSEHRTLHIMTVGDKHSQKQDNTDCCRYIDKLPKD